MTWRPNALDQYGRRMILDGVVGAGDGVAFDDGDDRGRVIVSSAMTDGAYSVLEWVVAPSKDEGNVAGGFGVHRHGSFEETFLVRGGELEFMLDGHIVTLASGDFVRVSRTTRHGYRNLTSDPVDLIVTFVPGGFEELFVKYRTDGGAANGPGFVNEATSRFDSFFE